MFIRFAFVNNNNRYNSYANRKQNIKDKKYQKFEIYNYFKNMIILVLFTMQRPLYNFDKLALTLSAHETDKKYYNIIISLKYISKIIL